MISKAYHNLYLNGILSTIAIQEVPNSQLCEAGTQLGLPMRELAALLVTTERTIARRLETNSELNKVESEHLLLLQRLSIHGVEIFED
jgi:hypothetical protein